MNGCSKKIRAPVDEGRSWAPDEPCSRPTCLVELEGDAMGLRLARPKCSFFVLTWFMDAGDTAPSTTRKPHQCQCVQDYEGTKKKLDDTFHSHAKSQINALKILSELVAQRMEGKPSLHKHTMSNHKNFRNELASQQNSIELAVHVPSPSFLSLHSSSLLPQPVHGERTHSCRGDRPLGSITPTTRPRSFLHL